MIFSCKPKPAPKPYCEDNPVGCTDIQGVKNFFCFKMGSWWVYEEEFSGERDSVYVTESINHTANYDFDMRIYSTYQDYYYHYFPIYASGSYKCNPSGDISTSCVRVKRSKYKASDYQGEGNCFLFTYNLGDSDNVSNTSFPNNKIIIESIYPQYNNGLLEFAETVMIHELNTLVEGKQPTNHYYSKGVGLIRKELLDSNQVWNLVDYHIEP